MKIYALVFFCLLALRCFAQNNTCEEPASFVLGTVAVVNSSFLSGYSFACGGSEFYSHGIWVNVTGTGGGIMVDAWSDSNKTSIAVLDSCDRPGESYQSCIAVTAEAVPTARLVFKTESDRQYRVFIGPSHFGDGFAISLYKVDIPTNYQCQKAVDVNSLPFSVKCDNTKCADVFETCRNSSLSGLWYRVRGTGNHFSAYSEGSNGLNSTVSVFSQCDDDGGGEGCMAYSDSYYDNSAVVSWRSVENNDYWVFVAGHENHRGKMVFSIEELNPHSYCDEPIVITSIPFYYSSQAPLLQSTFSECRNKSQHSVFFNLPGVGRELIATTCGYSSFNKTVIDVYEGCSTEHPGSGTKCVAYNDDYCKYGSTVRFNTTLGKSYFIAVSSETLTALSFSLAVLPFSQINDRCWLADEVTIPVVFSGNTTTLTTTSLSCVGPTVPRRGAWYRYTHHGIETVLTASTCNDYNMVPVSIELYIDCTSCVTKADPSGNCTTLSFAAEDGKNYSFFITASDPNSLGGFFYVTIVKETQNLHGTCQSSYYVARGDLPFRIQDDTSSSPESYTDCDKKAKKGVWVCLIGTGKRIRATTCDIGTGFDARIQLFDGCPDENHRNSQHCLNVNSIPSCGNESTIEWESVDGAYYWLFVTGFSDKVGVFVLKIYEMANPVNDQCSLAVGVRTLPFYNYGLTTYSQNSNDACMNNNRKGIWYEIVGNNHWITVSTCNVETEFATQIEVYTGCSYIGPEGCVAFSHDCNCSPKTEITFAGTENTRFYIFVTGVGDDLMSEGFVGVSMRQGDMLPLSSSSSSHSSSTLIVSSSSSSKEPEPSSPGLIALVVLSLIISVLCLSALIILGVMFCMKVGPFKVYSSSTSMSLLDNQETDDS